jgi:hypothetical protein
MKRLIVGLSTTVLVWGGVAGVMGAGTAEALPSAPVTARDAVADVIKHLRKMIAAGRND